MRDFEVVCEVEPATRADLMHVRHQIGVLSKVATAFLIPDNHIGRATVSSVAVAHEVALMGGRRPNRRPADARRRALPGADGSARQSGRGSSRQEEVLRLAVGGTRGRVRPGGDLRMGTVRLRDGVPRKSSLIICTDNCRGR